ncbi:hypothetical protein [Salimicrobium flavidum]|uniref:Uncharacterized protein n=1 Tax=Salimicrobium flavidum TaxID=570947 RepID=A0A1N7J337_9BACI|nr:hypothetical protein [Salimicrobium flavidum]SIS43760.1 hypothetical protein SAMN05421687_103285 [Salimicrobium flavidum]
MLSETVDHLFKVQKHGRTAEEVFGDDPKGHAEDITGELPAMMTKKRISLVITGVQSDPGKTIHLGSFLVKAYILIPLGFLFIRYMGWTTFRDTKRSIEFLRPSLLEGAAFVCLRGSP